MGKGNVGEVYLPFVPDATVARDSFKDQPPLNLPHRRAGDGTGFEVEHDVEKDGKRREKDGKRREKDGKGREKDEKRGKTSDYLSIQYRYRARFRQIG